MAVSTVSAYWVIFGRSSSTVIRQLNVGIKDTASAPPDLQTQLDAMKLENEALKKANNDTSTRKSSSKPKREKIEKPCAICNVDFTGFKGQHLCPTC